MRAVVVVLFVLVVPVVSLTALAAVVELPGERAVKERLGFEYEVLWQGKCLKVPGKGPEVEWRSETPLVILRDEAAATTVDGQVYMAGGVGSPTPEGSGISVARFDRFDPATGRWERLPDLPMALNHAGLVAHDGLVYLIGGFRDARGGLVATDRAFSYEPSTRTWEELPRLAEARGAHGVAVVGDRIFVLGGRPDNAFDESVPDIALVEVYDTRTRDWSRETTMPEPRDHFGIAESGGKLFVFGGRLASGQSSSRLDSFDPGTRTWTRLADGPTETSGIAFAAGEGFLHTAGGEVPLEGHVMEGAWTYRPATDTWDDAPRLPSPRHGYATAIVDGRLYIFGGSTCPGLSPTRDVVSRTIAP